MVVRVFVVDAFVHSDTPFTGNPAAICVLDKDQTLDEQTMKAIAREMNHSETAFVKISDLSSLTFTLRWLTPTVEVNLCGHATLATAHTLFELFKDEYQISENSVLQFETKSGILKVQRIPGTKALQMDFPQGQPSAVTLSPACLNFMCDALQLKSSTIIDVAFCGVTNKLIVQVDSIDTVRQVNPNQEGLLKINWEGHNVRGISVTAQMNDFDFGSRYFSPWNGIPEDPVNGSSHTILPLFWAPKLNKTKFRVLQASQRQGDLEVEIGETRIYLGGQCKTVLSGQLFL